MLKLLNDPNEIRLFKTFVWRVSILAVLGLATALQFMYLDWDLPFNSDPDEAYYFLWSQAIRYDNGDLDSLRSPNDGTGYPPAYLYMLVGQQFIQEQFEDIEIPAYDYFLVGRIWSRILGVLSVAITLLLTFNITKSRWAAVFAGYFTAFWPLLVDESRRASPNASWWFFTILVFLLLYYASNQRQMRYLYLALAAGMVSFLLKYQSGILLGLPLFYAWGIYWKSPRQRWQFTAVWGVTCFGVILWLLFGWNILEMGRGDYQMDSVSTITADGGSLVGLQSFWENFTLLEARAFLTLGQTIWTAVAFVLAGLAVFIKHKAFEFFDYWNVLATAFFVIAFYLFMSLFDTVFVSKWMVVVGLVVIFAVIGVYLATRAATEAFWPAGNTLLPALALIAFSIQPTVRFWDHWTYQLNEIYEKPDSRILFNHWMTENLPDGARVVLEGTKHLNIYPYAPPLYHTLIVESLFDVSVEDYRNQGYEYVIWNSIKGPRQDFLEDLNTPERQAYLAELSEVVRFTNAATQSGPDIIVYKIDPPIYGQQRFATFGNKIALRGYDAPQQANAGDTIDITLHWQSIERTDQELIFFVHILDTTGTLVAQHDSPPNNGLSPTWQWLADRQYQRDLHQIQLPDDLPNGAYTVSVGMYDVGTQARELVTAPVEENGQGAIQLYTIEVSQ